MRRQSWSASGCLWRHAQRQEGFGVSALACSADLGCELLRHRDAALLQVKSPRVRRE